MQRINGQVKIKQHNNHLQWCANEGMTNLKLQSCQKHKYAHDVFSV